MRISFVKISLVAIESIRSMKLHPFHGEVLDSVPIRAIGKGHCRNWSWIEQCFSEL